MKRQCLLIFGLAVTSTAGLTCYFCKSDYNSGIIEDEEKTNNIPHCGKEPYEGNKEQAIVCDIYYDHFGMTYPSFRKALSSTTKHANNYKKKKKRNDVSGSGWDPELQHQRDEKRGTIESTPEELRRRGHGNGSRLSIRDSPTHSKVKASPLKTVYPYNLSGEPWGSQRIHHRVKPYLCLTVHTVNSTFPNRVCGLRYFLDCPLLIQLTSEPLEQSSFITSCHQCKEDFCNTAARREINFIDLYLIFTLIATYCVNVPRFNPD